MLHQIPQFPLRIWIRGVHVPEKRSLTLVQVILVKDCAGHRCYQVFRRLIDLLHKRAIVLDFARKNIRRNIECTRELAEDALDDLTIMTVVEVLRDQLDVRCNDNHQKPTIVFRIELGALNEAVRFIQKCCKFRPTLLYRFKSCLHENVRHLFFRKFAFG